MNVVELLLVTLCITLVLIPPKWDPAILIKEYQMGHTPSDKFWKGMRSSVLPCLALWASLALIAWIVFLR